MNVSSVASVASMRKVALASFIGALMEWYDFYIYATASAIVFGQLFFPAQDRLSGTAAAFGTFAAGFLARPLGGLIFGHIGDRAGRKASLVLTLGIIGAGTFLIGLLPTWSQAGSVAPLLLTLLRVAQGIGLGGEYGGAALMTIEHARPGTRGFWGSLPQVASPAGLLLATGVFGLVSLLPGPEFLAWGWRLPFLGSILMLAIGLFIRLRIDETPDFEAVRDQAQPMPALTLMREHKRTALLATGARLAETVSGNMVKSFGLTYATQKLGLPNQAALSALLATSLIAMVATPVFGWLSDRLGRRPLYLAGAMASALLAMPFFLLLDTRTTAGLWAGFALAYTFGPTLMLSVQATYFSEMFGAEVRYTGLSVAYQVSAIVGGFVPLLALTLLRWSGGAPWPVAAMLALVGFCSAGCVLATAAGPATRCRTEPQGVAPTADRVRRVADAHSS
jgi:MFS transporter, MHS family, shikimate and dehydroshikimate transport protein